MSFFIVEGYVTRCEFDEWEKTDDKGKVLKSGVSFRFTIGDFPFIIDDNLAPDPETGDLTKFPPVGQYVRALVSRVWSKKHKKEFFILKGFETTGRVNGVHQQVGQSAPMELAY